MDSYVCQFYQLVNAKVLTVPSIDFITQLRLQEIQKNNKKGTLGIVRMLVKVNICIFLGHISSKNIGDQKRTESMKVVPFSCSSYLCI